MKNLIRRIQPNKLSVLDYMVIIILVFVIGVGLVFFSREKNTVYISLTSIGRETDEGVLSSYYWISNSVASGSAVYSSTGDKIAEVLSVVNVDESGLRRHSSLQLKVNAIYDKRTNIYRIGDNPLLVGKYVTFDIGETSYRGMITYVGETPESSIYQPRYMVLQLKVSGVQPWLADTYNDTFVMNSTEGDVVFKITNAVVQPADVSVPTADGRIVRSHDPVLKDVYIDSLARVTCQEDTCFFNEFYPVKIGLKFGVQSDLSIIDEENTKIIGVGEFSGSGE